MLKVLHIIPSLAKGGAERLVADICSNLAKQQLAEVLLVVMSKENEYAYLTAGTSIVQCSSRVVPSISGKSKVDIAAFMEIVKTFGPHIIHSHLFEAELLSRWETVDGVAYISHCHNNIKQLKRRSPQDIKRKVDLTEAYERQLMIKKYRKCHNHFIAISSDTELFLKKNLPKDLHRIMLLSNAVDVERFKRPADFKREQTGHDMIRLVNTGSFVDNKNQAFLIDVALSLKQRGYLVNFDLLGDGPNRSKIENKIKDNGLYTSVFCHGRVDNVEEYLHNADIYVHAALSEAFGLVLIEAMAAGLPVICLDGIGNRDIVEEGKNGFMITGQDPELFADKILQLHHDIKLYTEMSGYTQHFAGKYDMKQYVVRLSEYYQSLLKTDQK